MFEGWEIPRSFQFISKIGYDGVEIAPFTIAKSLKDISSKRRKEIRDLAEGYGLEVVGLHWLLAQTSGLHINHPEKRVRQRTMEYLIELINFCGDIGGSIMVIGSPKQRNLLPNLSNDDAWGFAKEVFQGVLPQAEKREVTLCLEPLSRDETDFINTSEEALRIVKELSSPNFGLILDVKAMSREKIPIPRIIEGSQGFLRHFHANDANRRGPGFGSTDFHPIIGALQKIGYEGYISVEVFDSSPNPEKVASESLGYLRSCLKKTSYKDH